jgi:hypothetical protein
MMAVQLVRPALRLLSGRAACMAASCCSCMTWRFVPPHSLLAVLVLCVWAHAPVGARLLVRGGDSSCEAETRRARRRLVVRGGDSSCEAETHHARPLTVKFRQPSHEFTFGVGTTFIPYPLVLTPLI